MFYYSELRFFVTSKSDIYTDADLVNQGEFNNLTNSQLGKIQLKTYQVHFQKFTLIHCQTLTSVCFLKYNGTTLVTQLLVLQYCVTKRVPERF